MARFRIDSEFILQILYASSSGQRFTQDTQVLPEVWTRLAVNPEQQTPCLLVPMRGKQAHHLADELHARVKKFEKLKSIRNKNRHGRAISDMPGLVSAKLHFDEIVNIILRLMKARGDDEYTLHFTYPISMIDKKREDEVHGGHIWDHDEDSLTKLFENAGDNVTLSEPTHRDGVRINLADPLNVPTST